MLVHGICGGADDLALWKERLDLKGNEDWDVRISTSITRGAALLGDVLQEVCKHLSAEVVAWVNELTQAACRVTLHFVCHSLGGLITRAALPAVRDALSGVRGIAYGHLVTLNTPHLGIHSPHPFMWWKNTSKLFPFSQFHQIHQVTLQDRRNDSKAPPLSRPRFLEELANPHGAYCAALALFKHRTAVAATHWDVLVPFCTAAISRVNPFPAPSLLAGDLSSFWRIDEAMGFPPDSRLALSQHSRLKADMPSGVEPTSSSDWAVPSGSLLQAPRRAHCQKRDRGSRGSVVSNRSSRQDWIKSNDWEVCFPERMLTGLTSTTPWRRIAYTLHRPVWLGGADSHLFTIGKDRKVRPWSVEFIDLLATMFDEDLW